MIAFLIINQMKITQIEKNLELGEKYLEEGKYEEAILAYDNVIKIDEKNVWAYEGKGATYLGMENYSEAETHLETAKSIDFTDNGKVLMSEVYINTDRKDQGMALVEEVAQNQPEDPKTVIQMADLYNQINENDKVIELLEKQIEITKDKETLKKLYDALIPAYINGGKSDAEMKALIDQAKSGIGEYTNLYYQYYASYAQILDEYRKAEASKFDKNVIKNLPDVTDTFSPYEFKQPLYFMMQDISGDAIPELVISGYDPNNIRNAYDEVQTEYKIIDTYRLVDGKPKRIFGGPPMGVRATYTICENQILKCSGSGGAANQHYNFYKIEGNSDAVYQNVEFDGFDGVPKYFLTDATHKNTQISKEEAWSIIDGYVPKKDIRWITL